MISAALIAAGYVGLIWTCGWPGVAVAAVHVSVMMLGLVRR